MPADTPTNKRQHILALDLYRVVVVALVVGVHILAIGGGSVTEALGAFIMVFHSSRELFFVLTAFVLTYNYGRRDVRWGQFWKRRYSLVLPAYIVWTVVYYFADGRRLDPLSSAAAALGHDLLTASARYQLYFLLVTMQLYLAFPLLRWLVRRTARHHLALFLVACAYQLLLTIAIQHHLVTTGLIGAWLRNPDAYLPSYVLYIIAGALAAWHFDVFVTFTRRHLTGVTTALFVAIAVGLGVYFAQIAIGGQSAATASAVFQPAVILESLAIAWAVFAVGLIWEEAGARYRRLVSIGADSSFGIYLAHPLLLQGAIALAGTTGILAAIRGAPAVLELAALLGIGLPVIYGVTGALVFVIRHTPLSVVLTGHQSVRPGANHVGTTSAISANPRSHLSVRLPAVRHHLAVFQQREWTKPTGES